MISEEIEKYKKERKKKQRRVLKYVKPELLDAEKLRQADNLLSTPNSLPKDVK